MKKIAQIKKLIKEKKDFDALKSCEYHIKNFGPDAVEPFKYLIAYILFNSEGIKDIDRSLEIFKILRKTAKDHQIKFNASYAIFKMIDSPEYNVSAEDLPDPLELLLELTQYEYFVYVDIQRQVFLYTKLGEIYLTNKDYRNADRVLNTLEHMTSDKKLDDSSLQLISSLRAEYDSVQAAG